MPGRPAKMFAIYFASSAARRNSGCRGWLPGCRPQAYGPRSSLLRGLSSRLCEPVPSPCVMDTIVHASKQPPFCSVVGSGLSAVGGCRTRGSTLYAFLSLRELPNWTCLRLRGHKFDAPPRSRVARLSFRPCHV